ncbi:MAG: aminotransferase class V-fold PLP-dependent enzyme [Acidobacteriota bacterium]
MSKEQQWNMPSGSQSPGLTRRGFLRGLVGGSAVGVMLAEVAAERAEASLRTVAQAAAEPMSDAEFWAKVRGEFMISEELAFMNNGTLGPTPKPVFYTVVENYRALATDPATPNTLQSRQAEDVRKKAAAFVGAGVDEMALTRNTTEGMNFVANGLDLEAGDEILLTFHEHPGGLQPWKLKAKRAGIELKELEFPIPTAEPADIVNLFRDAITPRTKVISVSHATYPTGCMIPIKEIATLAREKGILTVVDGAHPLGMMKLDMHDLGIDFYAMSAHKWLDAPTGTGLLYVRREVQDRLWPTIVTAGWDDEEKGAARFDRLSQRAWPLVLATGAAMDFQNAIGRERIERRVRDLATLLRRRIEGIDGIKIHTSEHRALCCGLTGFAFEPFKNRDVVETLFRRHHIRVRSTEFDLNTVRVSTHYYNTQDQVERVAEGLKDILKRGVIPAPEPTADDD